MPNVRASSGTIGTTSSPISLSRSSFDRIRTNTIVVEALRPSVPLWNSSKSGSIGAFSGSARDGARRHEAAERLAALAQVLELGAVVRRTVERRVGDRLRPRSECRSGRGTSAGRPRSASSAGG